MVMSVLISQPQNSCTNFDEIGCEEYATASHTFNFVQLVIAWRTKEFLR
jgi:hypothetical protein